MVRRFAVIFAVGVGVGLGGCTGGAPAGGGAKASLSATAIDFASVGCAAAATTRTLTVMNTGTAALTFSTNVTGMGFSATPASGSIGAGESGAITLSASVPATAVANTDQAGTLTIETNDPANAKLELGLKLKTSGVTLTLTPTTVPFGVVRVGTEAPSVPVTLTNTGSVPATITFTQPTDPQFSLSWTGSPAAATVAPGASVAMLAAGFKPSKISASTGSAAIAVAEPVCGASVAMVPMTGQGTNGVVGFSTTDVFFGTNGRVNCGSTSPARTFNITNTGNQAFSWTGTVAKGAASPFTFSPTSGTVPANTGSVTVTVNTTAIPANATTATDAFGDTLSIVTDVANDTSHPITLHQTANGASLSFVPNTIDFGMVPVNNTANAPFSVVNDGNAKANVTLTPDNARFTLSPSGAQLVDGGIALALTATFAPGASVIQENATVAIAVDAADVLCAPLPAPAMMTGTGTNAAVSYTPVALDFGSVNCGTTAAAKTVVFKNSGNQDYTITSAALGKGAASPFTIQMSPDSGVVPQDGGTVVITATPKAIPQTSAITPNLYGDTLTVTTDVPMDTPHDIPLRETARGAIFAISATTLNFGSVAVGANAASQFTASNTGNAPGTLNFTSGQPAIFQMPMNATVNANSSSGLTGNFTPLGAMSYSDTANLTVSAATVLCQPLPFTTVALSGSGSAGNVVALSTSSLTFGSGGLVPCGTTGAAQTVTVTNNSSQTLTITPALAGGASSPYTVSASVMVSAGANTVVTVTPKPIPATASTAADGFAGSLSINATGGVVNETQVVALHQTAQGAVLTFNPGGLSWNSSTSQTFTVNNVGNLSAPYALTKGGTDQALWTLGSSSGTATPGGSVSHSISYARPLLGGARSANVAVSTSVVRCAPLPAPLTLAGN